MMLKLDDILQDYYLTSGRTSLRDYIINRTQEINRDYMDADLISMLNTIEESA